MQLHDLNEATIYGQAAAAGFASPELYILSLLKRDAERLTIQQGIDALEHGNHRPFEEFDREFRERNKLTPHP